MAEQTSVDEPGIGAIVMLDFGFENGGALRTGMFIRTAVGWSVHPDGRMPLTWEEMTNLKRMNRKLRAIDPNSDKIHGFRLTVLAYSPADLLASIMAESNA